MIKHQTARLMPIVLMSSLFLIFVSTANAYETTSQSAFTADGKTGIFLIEYRFGHEDHRLHMPLVARNTTETEDAVLSYSIFNESGERATGESAAVILGGTTIRDSVYLTPRGAAVNFTLLVIFTPEESGDYHLQVEHLPFTFDDTQKLQLNQSELQYYVTESLTLDS